MTEIETGVASVPQKAGLPDLEASAVKAVEACLINRTGPGRLASVVAAGEALALLKGSLSRGEFTGWVRTCLPVSSNTVERYLKAYRKAVHGTLLESRLKDRRRESPRFDDPAEELRALLLALSVIARQGLPLARSVEESERSKLGQQAREAAALLERLASELSGGKVQ